MTSSLPKTFATLLQYGLPNDFAKRVHDAGLTVTKARALSITDLISKYGLSPSEAKLLTESVRRQPIDPDVVNLLLQRSNFLCNVCKGDKGVSYILHHIVEYEQTQDNTYDNLVVLCPNDHDLAHQRGLTLRITVDQLRQAKEDWEHRVKVANAQRAAQKKDINDDAIDYGHVCQVAGNPSARQSVEILPQLQEKYPQYLRPEMTSVQFVQSQDRSHLEITTADRVRDYLVDETSKRTDLAFVSGGSGAFFSPSSPITENVRRFISEFDEVSIIHCTDLFTNEAATRIDEHWRRCGVVPGSL
jgi:hypothetical protein